MPHILEGGNEMTCTAHLSCLARNHVKNDMVACVSCVANSNTELVTWQQNDELTKPGQQY